MKCFHIIIYLALLFSGLIVLRPGFARATIITDSDVLTFTFDGETQTKTITEKETEKKGERVTEEFNFKSNKQLNSDIFNNFVFLVEPTGATQVGHDAAGVPLYSGIRSDKIYMRLNNEKDDKDEKDVRQPLCLQEYFYSLAITLISDEDYGTKEKKPVIGYLEAGVGSPVDITRGIFTDKAYNIITSKLDHTVDVTVASDVEKVPEPATLILLGLGFLGVVAAGRKMRSEAK